MTEEVCDTETYIATCEASSVIAVTAARYGRMSLGRCVINNYGYLGCSVDVQSWASGICDNQTSCELSPSGPGLEDYGPCPQDLRSYLEITYTCVAGNHIKYHSKCAF